MEMEVRRKSHVHGQNQLAVDIDRLQESHTSCFSIMESQHANEEFFCSKACHVEKEIKEMKQNNTKLIKQLKDEVTAAEKRSRNRL